MKKFPAVPFTALVLASILAGANPSALLAGGGPQNLLVVVNDASQDSLDVANHYRIARDIPSVCFCHLNLKPVHDMAKADFEEKILEPVLEHIRTNGLESQVRFVVFTKGLPYRIQWSGRVKVSATTPMAAGSMDIGLMKDQPYYEARGAFRTMPGMPYLSICLTGFTVEDVVRCIDQGVKSDETFPKGTVYMFDGIGPRARVHASYGRPEALEGLKEFGIKTVVRPGHSLKDEQDVFGYWTGFTRVNTKNIRFLPGALADHLTSFGGQLFTKKGQMSILEFIGAGATGSYGTVMEPTNIPTRHSKGWVFCRYASGLNLIESYWSCVQDVQIGVFVGEPLAAPFTRKPKVAVAGPGTKKSRSGDVKLKVTALPAKEGTKLRDLTWWVDGRPFGPVLPHDEAEGTKVVLTLGNRPFKTVFHAAEGVEGLVKALADAVEKDEKFAKEDGIRAEAQGGNLLLEARKEGPEANRVDFVVDVEAPRSGAKTTEIKAAPVAGVLEGGKETAEIPARLELTLNAKKPSKGDTLTLVAGKKRFVATMTAADLKAPKPLESFLRRFLGPLRASGVFGEVQAALRNTKGTSAMIVLLSAKKAEAGNGQEVAVTLKKEKKSQFSVSPTGKRTLTGGVTRKYFAGRRIDFYAVFTPPEEHEVVFDTKKIGDGYHRLTLVAEEDSDIVFNDTATTEIHVANRKGKLRLTVPRKATLAKPFAFSARFTGVFPGGPKRIVLLVDGREVGEFKMSSKKFVFDRTKIPIGAGAHTFQARVIPRKAEMPTITSAPVHMKTEGGR
ncbi:MAG: TIGR03790 family protein [Planctomycetota bacterium]|jgi:uncharacterized protein (TIGR03790 family)